MSVNGKIRMIMTAANVSGRGLAAAFGTNEGTAAMKVSRGIKSISDLLIICNYCGASLTITAKDGTVLTLSVDDLEEQTKTKE